MSRLFLAPALLALAFLSGCAAPVSSVAATPAPKVGEQLQMSGRLAIKGSMPMLQAILTNESGQRWELKGIQPGVAARLQNKKVAVEGKVVRSVATPMLLPSLAVTNIELKQ